MSINVYLSDGVTKLEGYKVKQRQSKDNQQWEEYYLPGIYLSREKGRFYTNLHYPEEPIPQIVKDIVEEISFYEWIPLRPRRICGMYEQGSARAILDEVKDHYGLHIRGKNLEDIRDIYFKIRAGTILPTESWEEEQQQQQVSLKSPLTEGKKNGFLSFVSRILKRK